MRKSHFIAFVFLGLLGSIFSSIAQMSPAPALNPTKYESPSKKFVCEVDPSDLYGRGEGNYRITVNGELIWQGTKPFTLYEAGITDEGTIAGYAYTHGLDGFSTNGWNAGMGEFHIVIMRSTGEMILDEVIKRESSRFLHALPDPLAKSFTIDAAKDLFVVRLSNPDLNRRTEILRSYRLSTGKETTTLSSSLESPTAQSSFRLKTIAIKGNPPELSAFPNRPLKLLGTFSLREKGATNAPAIRDVCCFDFDNRGRIGFIREEPSHKFTFVHVAPEGDVLREVSLMIPAVVLTNVTPKAAWVEGDLWVIVASDCGVGGKAFAWWLDVGNNEFKAIPGFASPPIEKVSGSRDGGFVALVTTRFEYSMEDELIAFDKTGKIKWRIKQDYNSGDRALFSPEDVTVTTSGQVAVVDVIRKSVQLFTGKGEFLKVLQLEKIWGREPSYPSEITADKAGGVLVKDFDGTPPLVRMNAEGKIIGQFAPKQSDGRIIDAVRGIRVSPGGRVWACDGECFIRVTDSGVADLVLGNAPKETVLGKVAALTVDQRARIYAVDERSAAVHVFDENGSPLHVCKPDVADFSGKLIMPDLSANSDGEVYLSEDIGSSDALHFIHFGSDGRRLGTKRFGLDTVKQELHPLPNENQLLVVGYHDAYLLDRNAKVTRTIQRRPDRNWLEYPQQASIAPDGSFAIITGRSYGNEPWQVNLYSSTGDPIRMVEMPTGCNGSVFAYTGKHLVTASRSEICLFTNIGEPFLRFSPGIDDFESDSWECFATKEGRELWLASAQRKSVWRFELP